MIPGEGISQIVKRQPRWQWQHHISVLQRCNAPVTGSACFRWVELRSYINCADSRHSGIVISSIFNSKVREPMCYYPKASFVWVCTHRVRMWIWWTISSCRYNIYQGCWRIDGGLEYAEEREQPQKDRESCK